MEITEFYKIMLYMIGAGIISALIWIAFFDYPKW